MFVARAGDIDVQIATLVIGHVVEDMKGITVPEVPQDAVGSSAIAVTQSI
jgi:hypothetical protein